MINPIASDVFYFICNNVLIDVFVREEYNQIIIESWKHSQEKKGLEIYGWCIVPGHVRMIIGSKKK